MTFQDPWYRYPSGGIDTQGTDTLREVSIPSIVFFRLQIPVAIFGTDTQVEYRYLKEVVIENQVDSVFVVKHLPRGVLRDQYGNFILAFYCILGYTDILLAGFWGVLESFKMTWDNGYSCLLVQVDNSEVHSLLSQLSLDNSIPLQKKKAWFVEFTFVPREANSAADFMAKILCYDSSLLTLLSFRS
ncbi:hypothetical protein GQ457_13G006490 [Hibiscus cannabinus]